MVCLKPIKVHRTLGHKEPKVALCFAKHLDIIILDSHIEGGLWKCWRYWTYSERHKSFPWCQDFSNLEHKRIAVTSCNSLVQRPQESSQVQILDGCQGSEILEESIKDFSCIQKSHTETRRTFW